MPRPAAASCPVFTADAWRQVFEYFSNEKRPDGVSFMRPEDLLASLVAVYPAEGAASDRAGSLPGERRPATTPISDKDQVRSHLCARAFPMLGTCGQRLLTLASQRVADDVFVTLEKRVRSAFVLSSPLPLVENHL